MVEFSIAGAFSSDPRRPSIADFGMVPATGLLAHYRFATADTMLLDSSGNGAHATVDPAAPNVSYVQNCVRLDGGNPNGRLILPIMRAAGGRNPSIFTALFVFKSDTDALSYFVTDPDGAGISMYRAGTRSGFRYVPPNDQAANKTGEGTNVTGKTFDQFVTYAQACDGTRIYLSSDGAAWGAGTAIDAAGVYPPKANSPIYTGDMFAKTSGLLGEAIFYDRKLTDIELRGYHAYAKRRMAEKGHYV